MDIGAFESAERGRLRQSWWRAWRASVALHVLLVLAVLLVFGPVAVLETIPAAARAAAVLLCLGWAGVLRDTARRLAAIGADLAAARVEQSEGIASLFPRRGFGLIAPLRWRLALDGRSFDLTGFDPACVPIGARIRARWAARSGQLVSLQRIDAAPEKADEAALDERERALLRALTRGLSDKLIARELGLSPATIRTYNSVLFRRLGVADRHAAMEWARQHGFADVD